MRIAILGAGPAGLYLAALIKRRRPDAVVTVVEQNRADITSGFGVVLTDRALAVLRDRDPEAAAAIASHVQTTSGLTVVHRNERIVIDGIGVAAIGRLKLVQVLQQLVQAAGVAVQYGRAVTALDELGEADLVVGADGADSLVRRTYPEAFGTVVTMLPNRFAWFGTSQTYATLTQTFRMTPIGAFAAHHFSYAPGRSSFIVEMDEAAYARNFERLADAESRALCEKVFADALGGRPLIANNSAWRQFALVQTARWHHGRHVLIGDAARTAHFSTGAGIQLALEDAVALDRALAAQGDDVDAALPAFAAARRPAADKIVAAATASAAWYAGLAEHMQLAPADLAMSYMMRTGRLDIDRLRQISPQFSAFHAREYR